MATVEQVRLTALVKLTALGRPLYNPIEQPEAYEAYEAEYIAALRPFEWAVLVEAMDRVRDEWTALTWPPPGRIVQTCIAVEREHCGPRRLAPPEAPALPPPDDMTPEQRAVLRAKLRRLTEIMASGAMGRMTEAEARRFCEAGAYPADWQDRILANPCTDPLPELTPRQAARAMARSTRLQDEAAAARRALMGGEAQPEREAAG